MAKVIEIGVASDTKAYKMGIESGVIKPTEKAEDALKDFGKAGDKAGDQLDKAMRDAQDETKKYAKEVDDLGDKIVKASRKGSTALIDNTADSTRQASEELGTLKDEAISNASETFSSFDGSVDSFVDGIQGTFGGIVSDMGPIGAAIGGALAIGIGAAVARGEAVAEAIAEAKEHAAELAEEIHQVDGDLSQIAWSDKVREWGLAIEDSREWWEFWQEDAKTAFEVASEAADKFNLSTKDLALGLSGVDADRAAKSIAALTDQVEELEEARSRADDGIERSNLDSEIRQREDLIEKLKAQGNVTEDAIELNKLAAEVTEELAAADKAAADAIEARTDRMGALQGELDEAVNAWGDYYDEESKVYDPGAYIAGMQARMDATSNFNSNVQTLADQFSLSTDEVQAILNQGVDFAPMLQSIIDSGMGEQYAETIRAMLDGGQAIVDGTPTTATVEVQSNTDQAKADLDKTAEERTADVDAKADTKAAAKALDDVAAKKRTATITASVNTGAASTALANFINRKRTAIVTVETRDREGKLVP